jgi:hypothetical protein
MNSERMAKWYTSPGKVVINRVHVWSLIFISLLCATAYGQQSPKTGSMPPATFTVDGSISLDSLTSYVHHHSSIRFSFNSRKIKGDREILFSKGAYSLPQILQHIQRGTGLYYFTYRDHIIFQDNPPIHSSRPVHNPPRHQNEPLSSRNDAVTDHLLSVIPPPGSIRTVPAMDSNAMFHRVPAPRLTAGKSNPVSMSLDKYRARHILSSNEKEHIPSSWHLQTGASYSNFLYFNPGMEVGPKPIHLVLSWFTDFNKIKTWQLGLGSILLEREHMQLQLIAAYSPLKAIFHYDSIVTDKKYIVKGQFYNLTLSWCQKLGNHWWLKGGPAFNLLRTTYYVNGKPSAYINQLTLPPDNPDTRFSIMHTPLLIYNNFDTARTSNIKGWIGLSVGVYYSLPF